MMNSLLPTFEFWVYEWGLKVKQLDSASVSMLAIRFVCPIDLYGQPGPFCFSIQKKAFREVLKQIPSTALLKISHREDRLHLWSIDQIKNTRDIYKVSTKIMDETAPDEAADIEYEHSMELNISICSKFFKVAQSSDLPTDNVTFRILQHRYTKQTIFHMNYCTACNDEGDKYFSCGHGKDEEIPCDEEGMLKKDLFHQVYSECFHIEYLRKFLRSLEKDDNIVFSMGKGKPVCLSASLGVENSHVRYYIAPLVDDDE
jgi:hypothetical protein